MRRRKGRIFRRLIRFSGSRVLKLRLLKNLTFEQAGKQLRVTEERVGQIQNRALQKNKAGRIVTA
jgi:DNA-directed RNA polymerase sigma subunit (sigma70/sigma32)